MPEGQFTGTRSTYLYENDAGTQYVLTLDDTLATLANTGLVAATTANAGTATPAPKRFKPRVVFWQGTLNGNLVRKSLVCGDVTASLYATATSTSVTIDGIAGQTTGRRGEKLSYPAIPTAPTP